MVNTLLLSLAILPLLDNDMHVVKLADLNMPFIGLILNKHTFLWNWSKVKLNNVGRIWYTKHISFIHTNYI